MLPVQAQPSDTLCSAYGAVLPSLTAAAEERCAFASTGYFGGCKCSPPPPPPHRAHYRCNRLLGMCEDHVVGGQSRADCEAGCGSAVEGA